MKERILKKKCPMMFKIAHVKFRMFSFKLIYLAQFLVDFNNLGSKIYVQMLSNKK